MASSSYRADQVSSELPVMLFANLFRRSPKGTHRQPCRRRPGFEPRLEALEDRSLPSTLTVLNLNDAGPGSLRQAIADTNASAGADVIKFASGLSGTIVLTSGQLSIIDDLSIDGPSDHGLTVSGNNASRVFSIGGVSTDVVIRDLTISNGKADAVLGPTLGGGILNNQANLTLSRVTVSNNQALGGAVGSGG